MGKQETKFVGFRTSQELYDKLAQVAKKEERSVSNLLNRIIREALKDK